ncbi:MAG: hypothetical protein EOM68_23400 [Spirochaetia bacterium]|nr:hypothetical protein [Spirochaetia bacterium]
MCMKRCVFLGVLILVFLMGLFASNGGRYALVVGNGAYEKTTKLSNPVNDAGDVADMLSDLGFKVRLETNTTLSRMEGELSVPVKKSTSSTGIAEWRSQSMIFENMVPARKSTKSTSF